MVTTCAGIKLKQTNIEQIINIIFQMFFLLDSVLCRKYFRFNQEIRNFTQLCKPQKLVCLLCFPSFIAYLILTVFCSASKGWLNPPLRFPDEPCRHKVLDLIGDLSLFAQFGSQGLPVAHIVAYKACVFYPISIPPSFGC